MEDDWSYSLHLQKLLGYKSGAYIEQVYCQSASTIHLERDFWSFRP